jgi:glyoxylase-like metal-dependent hydrolase (beta-lactamase superfamily II)
VYTHGDWDHIWGTGALPLKAARIVGHALCLDRFYTDVPITLQEKQSGEPQLWEEVKLVPPNETFTDQLTLDVGSLVLTLDHLPGHTPDSIVVFLEKFGILFMGDTVETPCPCLEKESPLSLWIKKLGHWEQDDRVKLVIPAHGKIGGREIIGHTIAYLQSLSAGDPPELAEPVPDFYRKTHAANIRFAREAGQKSGRSRPQ